MVDWTSATADLADGEYATAFVPARVPGSPDTFKEAPLSRIVSKDSNGNAGIGVASGTTQRLKIQSGVGQDSLQLTDATNYTIAFRAQGAAQGLITGTAGSALYFGADNAAKWGIATLGTLFPITDNTVAVGGPSNRPSVIYAVTGTINTSDEREKEAIEAVPDAWLDAWGDVQWSRFKFKGRVRWHVGLVAQRVHASFAAHGIDAFEIGVVGRDSWDAIEEPIMKTVKRKEKRDGFRFVEAGKGPDGEKLFTRQPVEEDEEITETIDTGKKKVIRTAGDRWNLRYDECQAIEAAWQRRELARLSARIAAIEAA